MTQVNIQCQNPSGASESAGERWLATSIATWRDLKRFGRNTHLVDEGALTDDYRVKDYDVRCMGFCTTVELGCDNLKNQNILKSG